jgi:hypothetical protein
MDPVQTSVVAPFKNQYSGQVIEISNLRKGFGTQEVLKNVS